MKEYDFFIIGGGSAGYNAATAACKRNLRVGLADGGRKLGGLCILSGCMPSKALLESAGRYMTLRRAGEFGLESGPIGFSPAEIFARKERLVAEFAAYRAKQIQSGTFDFFRGHASFLDPHTVQITDGEGTEQQITAKTFLLATGSHIKAIPLPGLEEAGYWTSDDALESNRAPGSVIVLGGGATAVEFAHFYSALGSRVTIVQRSPQLLKEMDGDAAHCLADAYRKRGMQIFCHTRLLRAERTENGKRIFFEQAGQTKQVEAEQILYALGREPQTDGLGLEAAGLELTGGRFKVACTQQTGVPHIFAAGDVAGPYEIVHIAIQQGELAVRNAARLLRDPERALEEFNSRLHMAAIFSWPEVAMAGLTERELQEARVPYCVACYPFDDHGKSMIMGETDGFVKLLASRETNEIVGASIVGPHASELIHEIVVAMRFHATARDLAQVPHYHPTLSEIWTYPAEELANCDEP